MVGFSGGDKLDRYLSQLAQKLSKGGKVSIGFPESATYPDGTSVALVAAVNEFGAPSRGIPPRPFIRGMIGEHASEWGPQTAAALKAYHLETAKALGAMGEVIAGEMRQSIIALDGPPNAPTTIRQKGSSKPLIDTGQMLSAVTYWVEEGA